MIWRRSSGETLDDQAIVSRLQSRRPKKPLIECDCLTFLGHCFQELGEMPMTMQDQEFIDIEKPDPFR